VILNAKTNNLFVCVVYSTIFSICGKGYAMIVADTDTKGQTPFHDQRQNKLFKVLPDVVLASTACTCLTIPFVKTIEAKLEALPTDATKNIKAVVEIVASLMPEFTKIHKGMAVVVVGFADDMGVAYNFYNSGKAGPVNFTVAGGCQTEVMVQLYHTHDMKRNKLFKDHPDIEKHMAYDCAFDAFRLIASRRAKAIGDTLQIGHLYPDHFDEEELALKK